MTTKPETRELADHEVLRKNDSLKDEFGMCSLAFLWGGKTVSEFKVQHPKGKCLRSETRGRKPLPAEKRRVQRTVSFASDADQILSQAIQSEGWSRGKILDDLLRKSRS